MLRLNRYTCIQDIIQWVIKIPGCGVSILYKRNPDGSDFFTCINQSVYRSNKRIFMSTDELLCICRHAAEWVKDYSDSTNVLVESPETIIARRGCHKVSHLTISFSKGIISQHRLEVRVWKMCNDTGVFKPTARRIYISGLKPIKYLSEVCRMVITQTKKSEMLSNYVTVAHYMLYQEYYAFKKTLVDDSENIIERFLNSIDVQKFVYLFRKQ